MTSYLWAVSNNGERPLQRIQSGHEISSGKAMTENKVGNHCIAPHDSRKLPSHIIQR